MATKGPAAAPKIQPAGKQSKVMAVSIKKKKKKDKRPSKSLTARTLLEEYGLCPISMEPMRRPVLPSSGQAFDEINIVRYCRNGNKRCPVSGASLKFTKGKVSHTIDFALRNLIRQQASQAKVVLPSIDKDVLLRDLRAHHQVETAKAVVDDCYLGYIEFEELREVLEEFSAGRTEAGKEDRVTAAFGGLLAECLACRDAELAALAVEYIEVYDAAWNDRRVLYEAMAVGQDPDCRGQVLNVLEERIQCKVYGAFHVKAILSFETESVPVQQFQARVAEMVIMHGGRGLLSCEADFEPILNLALRVREDLDGCIEGVESIYEVWFRALDALKALSGTLDDACLDRLFWRENRMVLQHLAAEHEDLLTWHLAQQKQGLKLCVAAIGGNSSSSGGDAHDGMYTESEEDYLSEEEDAYQEDEDPAVAAAAFHEAYRAGLSEAANALGRRVNHYFPSLSRQSPINQTRATRF